MLCPPSPGLQSLAEAPSGTESNVAGRAGSYRTRLCPGEWPLAGLFLGSAEQTQVPGPTSQPLQSLFPPSPPHHQEQHEQQQDADQDAGDGH